MYLLRKIYSDKMNDSLTIEKGLECVKIDHKYVLKNHFWGETKIYGAILAIKRTVPFMIKYVNKYDFEPMEDGYIKLHLNYSTYEPDNVEGYIIFLENEDNINTTGCLLWQRYYFEAIVILKEGESLDFSGYHIEVKDGKLLLS